MDESRVTFTLNHVVGIINAHADAILRTRFDMTYSQFVFLLALRERPLSISAVATALGVSNAAVSKRVSWFTDRTMVSSTTDPGNRRRVLLTLTASGLALMTRAADALELEFVDAFSGIPQVDLAALNSTLNVIRAHLGALPKEKK